VPRRWWDDPDDPLLDEPAAPEPRREPEQPRPELRRRELPVDAPEVEAHARQRAEEEKRARLEVSAAMIEREYRALGLEPHRGADGTVTSLSLLLRMGWTVGETPNGGKVLLRPAEEPRGKPRS
jgi:hypothetical protein